jgi:hypothetical protein
MQTAGHRPDVDNFVAAGAFNCQGQHLQHEALETKFNRFREMVGYLERLIRALGFFGSSAVGNSVGGQYVVAYAHLRRHSELTALEE